MREGLRRRWSVWWLLTAESSSSWHSPSWPERSPAGNSAFYGASSRQRTNCPATSPPEEEHNNRRRCSGGLLRSSHSREELLLQCVCVCVCTCCGCASATASGWSI